MKKIIQLILFSFLFLGGMYGQFADPAVSGAFYTPNEIEEGETSMLTVSFANSGASEIPAGAIELTISTANNFYTTDGLTVPSGSGGALFDWVYLGADIWRGTNNTAVPPFGGGDIILMVTGIEETVGFETTNINVQPINNFGAFADAASNNNLQPELKVNPGVVIDPENTPTACTDGIDNDGDGLVDCADPDCVAVASLDCDGDGIPNGTDPDPLDLDTDDDGLSDGEEVALGTDPTDPDSDDDGVQDGTEIGDIFPVADPDGSGPLKGTNPALFTPDSDPSTTTNPLDPDSDDDGLTDGQEDPNSNGQIDAGESDPNDPCDPNSNNPNANCTNPENTVATCTDGLDNDGDGLTDCADPDCIVVASLDCDGDGLPNGTDPDPTDADTDDDGLSDGEEVSLGTSPTDPDTDNDGVQDGTEIGDLFPVADPDGPGPLEGTNPALFTPDSNPSTTTNPLDADTDDDGYCDGAAAFCGAGAGEDFDNDGAIDPGESNPNDKCDPDPSIDPAACGTQPAITVNDITVDEDAGLATVNLVLTNTPSTPVTVNFVTANETATGGQDYTASSGSITIPSGTSIGSIQIPIIDDMDEEGSESFLVNLSSPVGGSLPDPQALVTILDNDMPTGDPDACRKVIVSGGASTINLSNIPNGALIEYLGAPTGWAIVSVCNGNCNTSETISGLDKGDYIVKVITNNPFCYAEYGVSVTGSGGNPCDGQGGDSDGDGVCDNQDNCRFTPNADQADNDGDGIGNVCDDTPNGGGNPKACESAVITASNGQINISNIPAGAKLEYGGASTGYAFQEICAGNCGSNQTISGLSGHYTIKVQTFDPYCYFEVDVTVTGGGGNPCASQGGDSDGDGVCDNQDNCPYTANADQADNDGDGIGNVCDDTPNGGGNTNDCNRLNIVGGTGEISISDIPANAKIEYSGPSTGYQQVVVCDQNCSGSTKLNGLNKGTYNVVVQTFDPYCYKLYTVTVTEGGTSGPSCDDVTASMANGQLSVNGLNAPNVILKIYNGAWESVFECDGTKCPVSVTFSADPSEKVCYVDVQLYTTNWELICSRQITVRADGSASGRSAPRLEFTAFTVQRKVELQWASNSGWRNQHFELQKSTDGESFETIQTIESKGATDTDELVAYTEYDLTPQVGQNYYRIKEVRLDGTIEFTNIEQIDFGIDLEQFSIYPNPATTGQLNFSLKGFEGRKVAIQLISNFGQSLKELNIGKVTDTNVQLPIQDIPSGFYQVVVKPEGHKPLTRKLIIEKMY